MLKHRETTDPVTRRRRRLFAAIRISQATLAMLALSSFALILSYPQTRSRLHQDLYAMAWSSPRIVAATGCILLLGVVVLQLVAVPLKRRWNHELRGWIPLTSW